ncbi:hypothetical protein EJB05_29700 [Eragrostis curvula]|uniref:Peptidase C1A papain C-terminal domain-containing protein n=1 Tax=Eragrostis curvula TaxID=38414 RepID=A0A5J9UVR0_9POAL|nr:hypothetical protein EJB05_51882 [Eragrostis curvula]TVU27120.1 hypothetical protein EJB05_29700 [Eragrostis curvula]
MYEYHRRKNENLVFANFFKWKFSYAAKDLMDCFKFIRRLPLCMFSGIDDNDIALLLTQLTTMDADLRDIDNDALNFVFGISSPPKVKSEYYHNGVAAAHKLKKHMNLCLQTMKSIKLSLKLKAFGTRDEVKEYLLMQSRTVICTSSSCSNLNSMLSRLNRKDGHLIDLIVADVSSGEPSDDLLDLLFLPEIRNTALTTGITLQDSLSKKLSSEKLASINTKRHQFTKQYQCKERDMTPTDPTQQASSKPLTWTGIPKDMLATIRDQGDRDTCSLHSLLAGTQTLYRLDAAADKPQRTYTIELCVEDMESQYITRTGTEIGCELSDSEKGQSRAEHGLEILKQHGVLGKGKSSNEKVPVAFRISSFRGYHKEDSTEVYNLLKTGKVMIGNFRLSRNFFNLNPRKVYEFNARRPVVNPKNKLVRSHAIMFVGVLPSESSENEIAEQSELVYQNSAGKLFGEGGFGIVKFSSAKGFYQLIL